MPGLINELDLGSDFITKHPADRDKVAMVPRYQAAHAAHLALFQLQKMRPEEIVMGASVLFAALALRTGMDPHDLYGMGKKVLTAPEDGDRPTDNALQSLRDFIGARVMGKEVTVA